MERKVFGTKWDNSPDLSTNSPDFPGPKGLFRGALGCFWDAVGTNWDILGTFSRGSHERGNGDTGGESVKWGNGVAFTGDDLRRGSIGAVYQGYAGQERVSTAWRQWCRVPFQVAPPNGNGGLDCRLRGKDGGEGGRELRRPPREDHPDWKAAVSVVEPARGGVCRSPGVAERSGA